MNKFYNLYAFDNGDINDNKIEKDKKELKIKEIKMNDSFLINAYCRYKSLSFKNDMFVDDFIKIMISDGKDKSRKQIIGINFNGVDYIPWFATPSGMKKEDMDTHSKSEWLFIKRDFEDFANWFEDLISLGKIKQMNGKEMCINKDIIARIALATSGIVKTTLIPKIIILPECTNNLKTKVNVLDTKKRTVNPIDKEIENTIFDGCGLMSLKFANEIKQDLGLKQDISFAGIRMYGGLAVKGVISSVDFIRYFNEFYKCDTAYFKRVGNDFYIKDMYKEWRLVTCDTLILNETMCKWAKWFKNMAEIKELLNSKKYKDYKDLLESLFIVKTNKADEDLKEYTLSNYQLLSNLTITEKEIDELSKDTENVYKKILDGDEDTIRLFMGDVANLENDEDDKDIEIESMCTQTQKLLILNPAFINLAYVKRTVAKMINKKIKLLASGKFYIKGDYKTIVQDPIYFMDWLLNRKDNKLTKRINGMDAHKFYCSGIDNNEVRTISRCPLNSFSEIQNIKFYKDGLYKEYLSHLSKEILVFNCLDMTANILSGADFDMDEVLCSDEEIIKNSVLEDLPLLNPNDGDKVTMEFNHENRIEATLKASGNIIGSLAMIGMSVCNYAQSAGYRMYRKKKNDEMYSYDRLWDSFKDKYSKMYKEDTYTKFLEKLSESFDYIENYYKEKEIKEQIKNGFNNFKYDSYYLRNLQMAAIDAPKTLKVPEIPKWLRESYPKKPRFLYYAKNYIKKKDTINLDTALNRHASRISRELIKEDWQQRKADDRLDILKSYMLGNLQNKEENYTKCKEEIETLYNDYKDNVVHGVYNMEMRNLNKWKKDKLAEDNNDGIMDEYREKKLEIKEKYFNDKLIAEAGCIMIADKIIEKYENDLISHALIILKCSENFIFKFFFIPVYKVLKLKCNDTRNFSFIEEKSGDIEYLHKKYKKVEVIRKENLNTFDVENRIQQLKRLSNKNEIGFTANIGIGGCKLEDLNFNKVIIESDIYKDRNGNKKETIKFYYDNKEVGFIYPEYTQIDDFKSFKDYVGKEVNFKLINRKGERVRAVINYIA